MTTRRPTIAVDKTVHADAALAARIAGKNIQEFTDEALAEKSAAIIAEFKGNGRNGKRRSRHGRRDITVATAAH